MKKVRLLIIGALLLAASGCFPIFIPEGRDQRGHHEHDRGEHRDRDRGERR